MSNNSVLTFTYIRCTLLSMKIIRPEIRERVALAVEHLARERSSEVHTVTPTELLNTLILEEWERKHPGMMFPDKNGSIMPSGCTPSPLKH